ncbi:unnamed protein product [Amoebophrya sp. A25]|nr:unnamed protein product [Amoebophrya sp. A25]|eukprot:GSA25T00001367001.1
MADPKERSRLLNKQKEERGAVEKNLKKAKGAMKEKFEKELEALEERHAAEMAELEGGGKGGSTEATSSSSKSSKEKKIKIFANRTWDAYSKKELEEACVERGLGKKGGKEDLIMKLIGFHQEQDKRIAENPELAKQAEEDEKRTDESSAEEEDCDDEEDDDEDSEDDDEDAKAALSVSAEEAERQFKREQFVRKALRHALLKQGPCSLEELPAVMETVVKGFAPAIMGYSSLRKFAKNQPKKFMRFDKKENMCHPPKE